MKFKLKHPKKASNAARKALKAAKPTLKVVAPILLDVAVELVPGSKAVKFAAQVGKVMLDKA